MRNVKLTAAITGAVVAAGAVIALMLGTVTAIAASPTASTQPAATSAATSQPSSSTSTGGTSTAPNNPFGRNETVSDLSVVAAAIGISEADLQTALSGGKTIAAVATAHSVAPQKVIDALVTDGLNELAADVKAGTITQAQADAQKAEVTQRATDQVNGTFTGGHGGHGGPGGAGCPGGSTGSTGTTGSTATGA
jgi:hypothetical protein